MSEDSRELNEREITLLARLLPRLQHPLPEKIREALSQVVAYVSIDLVVLRHVEDGGGKYMQVLLERRQGEVAGEQWQLPSTLLRGDDVNPYLAIGRLVNADPGFRRDNQPRYVTTLTPFISGDAPVSRIYVLIEDSYVGQQGTWFTLGKLPPNMTDRSRWILDIARDYYAEES